MLWYAVTMLCGGVGSLTWARRLGPAERLLGAPSLAPYPCNAIAAAGTPVPPSLGWVGREGPPLGLAALR